ncbi:MAG: PLP-dependent aminotransferase family protein [Betaproteobacteria bacterium]
MVLMMESTFAARAQKAQRSELAALFALAEEPGVISFAGGFPDPEWFLPEIIEISEEIMRTNRGVALQYGPTPGFTALREFMAARLTRQGMKCGAADVLITSGSLQGLDLVCKIFLEPGDVVLTEAPTYIGALQTFASYEADIASVPTDADGMRIDELESLLADMRAGKRAGGRTPKFIYTIPSFQNPSGCTLSLERRWALLSVASRFGVPVVEDHAYAELRYDGADIPALKALDEDDIVVHLGTFSKIFSPGLRLGWMIGPRPVMEKAILFKQGTDQCSNSLGQMMALEYGKRGLIERQIEVTVASLRKKKDETLRALRAHFGDAITYTVPEGGFYTWVTFPEAIDTVELLPRAVKEHSVAYVAGPSFYADRSGANQARLCFSQPRVDQIEEGIWRLRKCFATFLWAVARESV